MLPLISLILMNCIWLYASSPNLDMVERLRPPYINFSHINEYQQESCTILMLILKFSNSCIFL